LELAEARARNEMNILSVKPRGDKQ